MYTLLQEGNRNSVNIMMKVILVLLLVGAFAAVQAEEADKEIDFDEIFANDRLYKKYFDCLMDKGKCPPDGQKLKGTINFLGLLLS